MKVCSKCKTIKPLDEFYKSGTNPDGLEGVCKRCRVAGARAWHKKNPDKVKRFQRRCQLKRNYGLTEAGFEAILLAQNKRCKICREALKAARQTHVDHCHVTKKVRGILCNNCNNGLGRFQDSPLALRRAAEYLETERACASIIDG